MQIEGRVALVTGAGSGIGEAATKLLVGEGARSRPWGGRPTSWTGSVGELGDAAMAIVADISKAEDMERAVGQVVDRWGRLDVVFANAGVNGVWAPIEDRSRPRNGGEPWTSTSPAPS